MENKERIVDDLSLLLNNGFEDIDIAFKQGNGNLILVTLSIANVIDTEKNFGHSIAELGRLIVNGVILEKERLDQLNPDD